MNFKSIFKRLGQGAEIAAPIVTAAANPLLGALLQTISTQMLEAEADKGRFTGSEKLSRVLDRVEELTPILEPLVRASSKKKFNLAEVYEGLTEVIGGLAKLYKAIGILP